MKEIDLTAMIAASLGIPEGTITRDSDSDSVSEWDSLAQVDLIAAVENAIDDRLEPREIARMSSVQSIIAVLSARDVVCTDLVAE